MSKDILPNLPISLKDLGLPTVHIPNVKGRYIVGAGLILVGLPLLAACEGKTIPASQITRLPRATSTAASTTPIPTETLGAYTAPQPTFDARPDMATAVALAQTAVAKKVETPTPTPQPSIEEQEKAAVEAALPGILAGLEAETHVIPSPVAGKEKPLSDEEKRNLGYSFNILNDAIQNDLLNPASIKVNPHLDFNYLLTDSNLLTQYWQGNRFEDITQDRHRILSFLPNGPLGGTAIAIKIDLDDGKIDDISMGTVLSNEGQSISQFMKRKIPGEDLIPLAKSFWRIPPAMEWRKGPYDSPDNIEFEGNGIWRGRTYRVYIDEEGYSQLRVIGKLTN